MQAQVNDFQVKTIACLILFLRNRQAWLAGYVILHPGKIEYSCHQSEHRDIISMDDGIFTTDSKSVTCII